MSPLQITAFDELQADFKIPIDQGNPLHAVSLLTGDWSLLFTYSFKIASETH